jgi:hypothetical protein
VERSTGGKCPFALMLVLVIELPTWGPITSRSRFDKPFGLELMAERLKALRHSKGTSTITNSV